MKASKLILLLFLLSSSVLAESKAYQFYRPINDAKVELFVSKALKELTYYGDFAFPMTEVHLRQSKLREEPRMYSRADILNWTLLNEKLHSELAIPSFPKIQHNLQSQLSLIKALNSLIADEKLVKQKPFSSLSLTNQQKKWAGKGFFGFFSEDHIKLNRNLLDTFLKDCVNSFQFIKRPPTGMQLCELADAKRGIYIIYLKHPVGSDAFYCELGHELFHTLDPTIYDWHMEGLANVFSEQLSTTFNFSWEHFQTILSDSKKPYGASYQMMHELYLNEPNSLKKFTNNKLKRSHQKSAIDTGKWLNMRNEQQKKLYKRILKLHSAVLIASPQNFMKIN
ncbi:MAG: hypothetical protein MK132_18355 [Lentisphaerales bacterium]|nr:hypothetical protein [Lentisphaerales bacterium]